MPTIYEPVDITKLQQYVGNVIECIDVTLRYKGIAQGARTKVRSAKIILSRILEADQLTEQNTVEIFGCLLASLNKIKIAIKRYPKDNEGAFANLESICSHLSRWANDFLETAATQLSQMEVEED